MNVNERKIYWKKVERLRSQLDKKYFLSIRKSIMNQFKRFASDVKKYGVSGARSRLGLELWEKELITIFEKMYKEASILFGNATYRALKIEANQKQGTFGFNREWTKEVLEFLMTQGFTLVSDITKTTKDKLIAIVSKGVEDGLSVDEIVKLILNDDTIAYANFRATRIVRTEIMRASNIGAMQGARAHKFKVDKQWISARDSRTRRIPEDQFDHIELDGVVVDIDEPFTSRSKDGVPVEAMQPGDITAPPGFTINCRCSVGFIPKRDINGRLIMKPTANAPKISPIEQIPIITNQTDEITFKPGKTVNETKKNLINYIKNKTGLNISKVSAPKTLSLEELNVKSVHLSKLFDEYKIQTGLDTENPVTIKFQSTKTYLGVVKSKLGVTQSGKVLGKSTIESINFGDKLERENDVTFVPGSSLTRNSSAVDQKNVKYGVITHEFAHVLAINGQTNNPNTPQYVRDYFKTLYNVFQEYKNEMLALYQQKDREGVYNISLGRYASYNLDEFHAEAFKEYKLKSNPSKYAVKVGQLIDKYFKR